MMRSIQVNSGFCRPRCAFMSLCSTLILLLLVATSLFGQASSGTASLSGTVIDSSGGVMPGVTVQVRNVATNVVRNLESNDVGRYEAVALQPGDYEVRASKEGFATL